MRARERIFGERPHRVLWTFIRGRTQPIEGRWFWTRFLDAATVVSLRLGPARAGRCLFGRPALAWALVLAWAAVPCWLLASVAGHLLTVFEP